MYKRIISLVAAFTMMTLHYAYASASEQPPQMPPRAVGNLMIDPITQAPLQVVYSAYLKDKPAKVFSYVTKGKLQKGKISTVKSDNASGIYAWSSAKSKHGYQDHLGVIHVIPSDTGGSILNWHSFYNHNDSNSAGDRKSKEIMSAVKKITKKFGGEFTGAAYGNSEVNIISDVVINASAKKVWSKSADDFGNVAQWSSIVGRVDSTGTGKSAGRTCHVNMPGNPSVNENMESYDMENMTFSYSVGGAVMPPFVKRAVNTWTLKDLGEGKTLVRAHMKLNIADGAPAPAVAMVKGQFFQMLGMGMEEFDYFVETGKPHARKLASLQMQKSTH